MTDNTDAEEADLVARIAAKKARLDALRPLPPAQVAQLDAWYAVELTWTSNAIEGNTPTRQETAVVLEKGITVRGKPLRDHMEALDHAHAWNLVRALADGTRPIREADIRDIHRVALGRSLPAEAGRYAATPRLVAGSRARFPLPAALPGLMAELAAWLAAAEPNYETAFAAHLRLVTIHPFADGNGRTARLLMNLLLLRAGYPPVPIAPEHRPDYLDALERAQADGDEAPYRRFMLARLDEALDTWLGLAAPDATQAS